MNEILIRNANVISSKTETPSKSQSRPRVSSHVDQSNLQSIAEDSLAKFDVLQPTQTDLQRDIQVLTLDDNNNTTNSTQDEVPF